ncbi:hypothetical protein HDU97_000743 [Phlyctochytrium planicorne]|nr:hypothetical protein HDU97_000743 [Phlyctochytrium planicorne]
MVSTDAIVVRAPAKVILFGEHAVVYGKKAIATSLGLFTYAKLQTNSSSDIAFNFVDVDLQLTVPFSSLPEIEREGDRVKDGVLNDTNRKIFAELAKDMESDAAKQAAIAALHLVACLAPRDRGLALEVKSFIPVGSGLGSSASFSVVVSTALLGLGRQISLEENGGLSDASMETINQWAFISEKVIHGDPSGIDNTVCTYGGAKMYAKGSSVVTVEGLSSLKFILTNTMVPKNTKVQVSKVRSRVEEFPLVMPNVIQAIDGIAQSCLALFEKPESKERSKAFQLLIDMNHDLLNTCGVGHPTLEKVRRMTALFGLSTKLTGAGGGGCMLTYIPQGVESHTVDTVISELKKNGFECYNTSIACEGVKLGILTDNVDLAVDKLQEFFEGSI